MYLALGLLGLLALIVYNRRPAADYGVVVGPGWGRQALIGLAIGIAVYAADLALCALLGVVEISFDRVTAARIAKAAFAALTAIVYASLHQAIFSGYLPGLMSRRIGWGAAIVASAVIFGVLSGLDSRTPLVSPAGFRLATGMGLIVLVLAAARLATGQLALTAGVLAGAMMVRRVASDLRLLDFDKTAPVAVWLAPDGDPRRGLLLWAFLLAMTLIFAVRVWRYGAPQPAAGQPALDKSFKRVLPFSNVMALAPLDIWLRKLWQARLGVGAAYLPRLAVSLIISGINTVLTLPERLIAPLLLRHAVPDPVFIVGVHRSGTTHLHNLMALDPRFTTPRNWQVFNPHGIYTGWGLTLLLMPFVTGQRPMDSVRITGFSPQEEEFATAAMTPYAPYWYACFPRLFAAHERYIYADRMSVRERRSWEQALMLFLRKITAVSRKRPLLKSPYNTARVAALRKLFPRAKFVHLVRNPYDTYSSNMHLADHGWTMFQLQDPDAATSFAARFLDNYRGQEQAFARDAAALPKADVTEVRYEDLDKDPVAAVRAIYTTLGLDMTPEFEQRLETYVARLAGYRKNKFKPMDDDLRGRIDAAMGDYASRWGYTGKPARKRGKRAKASA